MSKFEEALSLSHIIAEHKFDVRADEEESRRDQSGFGSGGVWHWSDLNEQERLTLAKNETSLARAILRAGWTHP